MAETMFGYAGKILEVDLTAQSTKAIEVTPDLAKKYLGGVGFGAYFLWNRMKAGANPLGPDNILMFMTGPMTGTGASGTRWNAIFKSPHTGAWARTAQGGDIGPELKYAGWDGILITGKSDSPVCLYINNDKVEIKDAKKLWGKDTHETPQLIEQQLDDPLVKVVCIGPAGENMVTFANMSTEFYRAFGRLGGGAVMGSKNLKAVAIRGTNEVKVADLDAYWKLVQQQRAALLSPANYWFRRWGTQAYNEWINDADQLGVKNLQQTWLDPGKFRTYTGQYLEKTSQLSRRACIGCANRCSTVGIVRTGPHAGLVNELDYEGIANVGSGNGHHDFRTYMPVETEIEKMGLDLISTGKSISFASELYQRGILTKADLGGIDLTWGNTDAQIALVDLIATRKGIGDTLAEGTRKAAKKIGKNSEQYAMVAALGNEISGSDPRSSTQVVVASAYVAAERGSCHNAPAGTWDAPDPIRQDKMTLFDSMVVCLFVSVDGWGSVNPISPDYLAMLNTATGWNLDEAEFYRIGERIANLEHAFNIREGFRRADWEYFPPRMYEEPLPTGPNQGDKLTPALVKTYFDGLYTLRGWDVATGVPTRAKLEELDLRDVADALKV
jgi:aldehyde:ferredoxin oxidoreductase